MSSQPFRRCRGCRRVPAAYLPFGFVPTRRAALPRLYRCRSRSFCRRSCRRVRSSRRTWRRRRGRDVDARGRRARAGHTHLRFCCARRCRAALPLYQRGCAATRLFCALCTAAQRAVPACARRPFAGGACLPGAADGLRGDARCRARLRRALPARFARARVCFAALRATRAPRAPFPCPARALRRRARRARMPRGLRALHNLRAAMLFAFFCPYSFLAHRRDAGGAALRAAHRTAGCCARARAAAPCAFAVSLLRYAA